MNKPTTFKRTSITHLTLHRHPVIEGIEVFKLLSTWERRATNGAATQEGDSNIQGFATTDAIETFLASAGGGKTGIAQHVQATLGPDGFVEGLRHFGIASDWFEKQYPLRGPGSPNARAYDALVNDELPIEDVVMLNMSSHQANDINGVSIPIATVCNYGPDTGQFHNGLYDLDRAAKILADRPDIRFVQTRPRHRDEDVPDGWSPIQSIPHYNADEERSAYIPCVWMPTREDWAKLSDSMGDRIGDKIERHAKIFELDLLGLRAGGAARRDSFYGEF